MSAEDRLFDNGYDDVIIFKDEDYDDALIGVSNDNRAIYDYGLMIEWLMNKYDITYEDAVDWIDYNTLRSLNGNDMPIILYNLR